MTEALTLAGMVANVEQSRGHIVKQDAIIARLIEQGHGALADEARTMLITMHEHLAFEIEMLARMERQAIGSGIPV